MWSRCISSNKSHWFHRRSFYSCSKTIANCSKLNRTICNAMPFISEHICLQKFWNSFRAITTTAAAMAKNKDCQWSFLIGMENLIIKSSKSSSNNNKTHQSKHTHEHTGPVEANNLPNTFVWWGNEWKSFFVNRPLCVCVAYEFCVCAEGNEMWQNQMMGAQAQNHSSIFPYIYVYTSHLFRYFDLAVIPLERLSACERDLCDNSISHVCERRRYDSVIIKW